MKCYYHNDADGKCSARLVYLFAHNRSENIEDYVMVNYPDTVDVSKISEGEAVYIVDYSIPVEDMIKLREKTSNIFWIDHHKSAIEKYHEYLETHFIGGIRDTSVAASMLCWLFFNKWSVEQYHEQGMKKFMRIPDYVAYIADYDAWHFEFGKDSLAFVAAFNSRIFDSPKATDWDMLKHDPFSLNYVSEGYTILRHISKWSANYAKNGFYAEMNNYLVFAMNIANVNSTYFDSIVDPNVAFFVAFAYVNTPVGERCRVSVYQNQHYNGTAVDLSEIAKRHGGGGHPGAAGFVTFKHDFLENIQYHE